MLDAKETFTPTTTDRVFYARHQHHAVDAAYRAGAWPSEIQDRVQDTFLTLFKNYGTGVDFPVALVRSIAHGVTVDAIRKQSAHKRRGEAPPPRERAIIDETLDLAHALDELPDEERVAVRLWMEGYSRKAAAETQGVTVSQYRTLLGKAKHALRRSWSASAWSFRRCCCPAVRRWCSRRCSGSV